MKIVSVLKYNKENKVATYVHFSCRSELKNKSRRKEEHAKMKTHKQTRELAEDRKLGHLILRNSAFIVVEYVYLTVNIPIVILTRQLRRKILTSTMSLMSFVNLGLTIIQRLSKDVSSGIFLS